MARIGFSILLRERTPRGPRLCQAPDEPAIPRFRPLARPEKKRGKNSQTKKDTTCFSAYFQFEPLHPTTAEGKGGKTVGHGRGARDRRNKNKKKDKLANVCIRGIKTLSA